jgi:hypothetical protein
LNKGIETMKRERKNAFQFPVLNKVLGGLLCSVWEGSGRIAPPEGFSSVNGVDVKWDLGLKIRDGKWATDHLHATRKDRYEDASWAARRKIETEALAAFNAAVAADPSIVKMGTLNSINDQIVRDLEDIETKRREIAELEQKIAATEKREAAVAAALPASRE